MIPQLFSFQEGQELESMTRVALQPTPYSQSLGQSFPASNLGNFETNCSARQVPRLVG